MFVLTFTFAVLFMKMYGHEPYSTSSYNDNLNFETFLSSYGIFLQISLGSYWDVAYEGLEGHSFGRCMIVTFMLLSVFIMIQGGAVIFMDNYHFIVQKLRFGVVDQNLEDFTYAWRILDPDATGFIPYNELSEFVNTLPAPLQIPVPNEDVIAALDIPIYKNDKVSFKDVLLSVLSRLNTEEDIKSLSSKGEGESDEIISSTLLRQQENQNPQTDNVN